MKTLILLVGSILLAGCTMSGGTITILSIQDNDRTIAKPLAGLIRK